MDQILMIERIPFPVFDRNLENRASFRRVFSDMVKESRQGPVLEMARLTNAVPEKVSEFFEGVMEPEKAWKRLDERYGPHTMGTG